MLGKLLKQDFRATARIMLPLYAAVPVLGLFTNLITRLCENQNGFLIRAIGALVSFVFSLSLIAAVVTTVVLMILRFYRNLMTDEGYLMFTLPVSTTELIFSKLIVSIVWFLGTFAVDALGLLLSGTLGGYEDIVRFRFAFTFGAPYSMPTITQAQAGWLTVGVVVLVVLCGLALCLMTYAAMAIGQSFKKNKGHMTVVFFFVLWIGTRLVLALIFGAFYGSASAAVNTMTVLQALWTVLGCACVGALAARLHRLGFWLLLPALLPPQIAPVVGDTFGAPHGSRFQPVIGHTQFVVFLTQLDSVFLVAGGIGFHAHPVSHRVGGALRHPVLQPQQPLYPSDFARQMLDYTLQPPRSPRRAKAVSEHQFWQLLQCVGQAVWHLPNAASRCTHFVWRRISTHPRPLCCQPMAVTTLVRTFAQDTAKLAG